MNKHNYFIWQTNTVVAVNNREAETFTISYKDIDTERYIRIYLKTPSMEAIDGLVKDANGNYFSESETADWISFLYKRVLDEEKKIEGSKKINDVLIKKDTLGQYTYMWV